jgi:uncharacterized membrane protein YedE/YeeE
MGRSLSGAALMGVGGVFAGGCTVGAGLSGVATLSVAALLALGSIVAGMLRQARSRRGPGDGCLGWWRLNRSRTHPYCGRLARSRAFV